MRKAGAKLLLDEYPLIVQPTLARTVGLHEAILLQQIHYWHQLGSGEMHDGRRWIFNSARQWTKQMPFLSEDQIARALTNLRKSGILLADSFNKRAYDRTLWYSIDYEALEAVTAESITHQCGMDDADLRNGLRASASPIPETTIDNTETTLTVSTSSSELVDEIAPLPFSESQELPKPTRTAKRERVKAGEAALYHWEKSHCRITDTQIETINEAVKDLPKWKKAVDAWLLRGYKPNNVAGPLEWYTKGLPVWGKGPPGKAASRESHYDEAELEKIRVAGKQMVWETPPDLF